MALDANPVPGSVLVIPPDISPVAWMRVGLAACMALDADIPFRMAGLAGLEIAPRLGGMLVYGGCVSLMIRTEHQMRLDSQAPLREAVMTGRAVFLVMATVTGLWIVQGLYRMDGDKIAPVTLGYVIPTEGSNRKVGVDPATLMTIEAPGLIMALGAVAARLACQCAVAANPITVMVRRYTLGLVAAAALGRLHFGIFLVLLFLSQGLLDIQC